jgi:hypothetical protein
MVAQAGQHCCPRVYRARLACERGRSGFEKNPGVFYKKSSYDNLIKE